MFTVMLYDSKVSVVGKRECDLPTYYVEHSSLEYIAYKNDLELLNKLGDQLGNCYIMSLGLNAGNGVHKPLTEISKEISLDAIDSFKDKRYNMFLEDLRSCKC